MKLEFWDKQKSLVLPNGVEYSATEIKQKFGFAKFGTTVLEYLPNGVQVGAIDDLANLRSVYQIDESLSDAEALAAIKVIRETPPEPVVDAVEAKLDYLIMVTE